MKKLVIIILLICFISLFAASLAHAKTTGNDISLHHAGCSVTIAETLNNLIDNGIPIKIKINHNENYYHIRYNIGAEQIPLDNFLASIPSILEKEQTLELSAYNSLPDRFLSFIPYNILCLNTNITVVNYTAQMYYSYDPLSFSATGELFIIAPSEVMEFYVNAIRAKGIEIKHHPFQNAHYGLCFSNSSSMEG